MLSTKVYAAAVAAFIVHTASWLDTHESTAHEFEYYYDIAAALPYGVVEGNDPQITPGLLMGMAYVESRFQPEAEGRILYKYREDCHRGERTYCPRPLGILQVVPTRAVPIPRDLYTQADGGFLAGTYLLHLYREHTGRDFLCHYGGGPHCARRYESKVRRVAQMMEETIAYIENNQICIDPFNPGDESAKINAL